MNYEEKYNEILEWARKNKARLNGVPIEEVLPELVESEDERIRKELKEAFEAYDIESTWNGIPIRSIFAWLEKQKEQRPISFYGHYNPDDYEVVREGNATSLKQKEQKPAEWSEEDENMAYFVNQFLEYHENADPTAKSCKKWFNNRLKSLRPSWKPSEEQMKALQNAVALTACDKELARLYNQLKKL